jgi:16S rRNA (cytosine1402-N4)-methyltransferase
VLLGEVLAALRPRSGGIYLDGTLGAGGYAEAILRESSPDGVVIALDLDDRAVCKARERLSEFRERFRAVHGGFHDAANIVRSMDVTAIDGAVLDLGLSSDQLEDPERGFSFRWNSPMDMRFDTSSGQSLADYLQDLSAKKLEEILATYGEERYCKKLARGIVDARDRGRLATTSDLVEAVTGILGGRRGKIHPATRTFQALRIAVNDEMANLKAGLEDIPLLLKPGGRFCVVSYHSLEDRQVKLSFRERARDKHQWQLVTKRPVRPSEDERRSNPRSRSARMRTLERIGGNGSQVRAGERN